MYWIFLKDKLLFVIVFLLYGLAPSVGIVVFAQALLRVFEYGFNKPSREIIYSQLKALKTFSVYIGNRIAGFYSNICKI